MHLSRRIAAPLVGAALALSVAVAPAAAATRQQTEPNVDVCEALSMAQQNLPDNAVVRQIWSQIVAFFDCENAPI